MFVRAFTIPIFSTLDKLNTGRFKEFDSILFTVHVDIMGLYPTNMYSGKVGGKICEKMV